MLKPIQIFGHQIFIFISTLVGTFQEGCVWFYI